MYIPEMVFGHLLTGSNFDDSVSKVTGGRNGYGAKLANIFSKEFSLEIVDEVSVFIFVFLFLFYFIFILFFIFYFFFVFFFFFLNELVSFLIISSPFPYHRNAISGTPNPGKTTCPFVPPPPSPPSPPSPKSKRKKY